MPENEKQQLQEELMYLTILIEFHNKSRVTVWKGKEPELEQQMDDMLDRYNEIRKQLNKIDNDDNQQFSFQTNRPIFNLEI